MAEFIEKFSIDDTGDEILSTNLYRTTISTYGGYPKEGNSEVIMKVICAESGFPRQPIPPPLRVSHAYHLTFTAYTCL